MIFNENGEKEWSEMVDFLHGRRRKKQGTVTCIHARGSWLKCLVIWCMTRHEPIGAKHVEKPKKSHLFFSCENSWGKNLSICRYCCWPLPDPLCLPSRKINYKEKNLSLDLISQSLSLLLPTKAPLFGTQITIFKLQA